MMNVEKGIFCKRPIRVRAIQFQGTYESLKTIQEWMPLVSRDICLGKRLTVIKEEGDENCLSLYTHEGWVAARPGDWIIEGIEGEYYPCAESIFDKTYDRVE